MVDLKVNGPTETDVFFFFLTSDAMEPVAEVELAEAPPACDGGADSRNFSSVSISAASGHAAACHDGVAYTWALGGGGGRKDGRGRKDIGNRFGQLGRGYTSATAPSGADPHTPAAVDLPTTIVSAVAGGCKDSGSTAFVDAAGALWMSGCDRWQQLGLGQLPADAEIYFLGSYGRDTYGIFTP